MGRQVGLYNQLSTVNTMVLISTKSLILIRSSVLWSFAYFLIAEPVKLVENEFVLIVSGAMHLVSVNDNSVDSSIDDRRLNCSYTATSTRSNQPPVVIRHEEPLVGLVALLLTVLGLQDVGALGADYLKYLEFTVPARLTVFFLITAYIYYNPQSNISNGFTFTYGFLEMILNFWIYATAREERNEFAGFRQRYDAGDDDKQGVDPVDELDELGPQ